MTASSRMVRYGERQCLRRVERNRQCHGQYCHNIRQAGLERANIIGGDGPAPVTRFALFSAPLASAASTGGNDVVSGNTLNILTNNLTIAKVQNFQFLHFQPVRLAAGDTILNVTGTADINKTVFTINLSGANQALHVGNDVTIINAGNLAGQPASMEMKGRGGCEPAI